MLNTHDPALDTSHPQNGVSKRATYAIFSGGGVKAAAFVGAIRESYNHIKFKGVGGTSAGAIAATLIACGFQPDEISDLLFSIPYDKIFKYKRLRFMFRPNKGLCDSDALLTWLRSVIKKKFPDGQGSQITFKDLHAKDIGILLKIVATDLSAKNIKIYSMLDTPNEEIAQAVLASCSFPFIFKSVIHGDSHIVDGGLISNFPMWIFDEERKSDRSDTNLLGYTLSTINSNIPKNGMFPEYLYSIFDSLLVAQDKVQEKYLDVGRLANVIRILIPKTATFDKNQTQQDKEALISAGTTAARDYFNTAPNLNQERVPSSTCLDIAKVTESINSEKFNTAISAIARQHILRGGVAMDHGLSDKRTYVKYYIDMMEATTNKSKAELLAEIICKRLPTDYERIIGIQKGNILLAAQVAYKQDKPLTFLKSETAFKMSSPFDGDIVAGERVILVDDIASDASMLLYTIRQLGMRHVQVLNVITLIERTEGDARNKLAAANCLLISICRACDADIQKLIESNAAFPYT